MVKNESSEKKHNHMTKIKLCGIRRLEDIQYVNELSPEYIGFVFARASKRYISPGGAKILKSRLNKNIVAVGVFVDESIESIAGFLEREIIDMVQLHGNEDEYYIGRLRQVTDCGIIKAFRVASHEDISKALQSSADYVLLDSGGGSGEAFDWSMIREKEIDRSYFLAGGLDAANVAGAITELKPFAVDVSSALETNGYKDKHKMREFVQAVRSGK